MENQNLTDSNQILQVIAERISVRKYTEQPVTEEQWHVLLNAGFQAPSAMNRRPWHFVLVRDRELLQAIGEHSRFGKMIPQAAGCIAVCGDKDVMKIPELLINDCSAAIQNILLAAQGVGLGAVWCGLVPKDRFFTYIHETLNLPEHVIPMGLISVGYPAETREQKPRFEQDKVHYDRW